MSFLRGKRIWRIVLAIALVSGLVVFVYPLQFHPEAEKVPEQRVELARRVPVQQASRIDVPVLLADLRTLSAPDMEGRAVGTPGGKKARDYLIGRFAAIGLEPVGANYEQAFSFTPGRGIGFWQAKFWAARVPVAGVNLVGRIRGSVEPEKYLLVTAHYDHLGIRNGKLYPGADDNASGVAAMLALASYFRAHPPRYSMLFVAFDGEERGLRGAKAFLDKPPVPAASMLLDINFDMLSRNPAGEIFLCGLYANPQLRGLVDPVRASAVPTILYGHDYPRPFWNGDDWTSQSDHGAFADRGIPFVYLGVEDHPDYHQPGDTFAHVDQKFYASVADAMVDLALALDAASPAKLARAN